MYMRVQGGFNFYKGARSHSAAMYFYPLGGSCCAEMWGGTRGYPHT